MQGIWCEDILTINKESTVLLLGIFKFCDVENSFESGLCAFYVMFAFDNFVN